MWRHATTRAPQWGRNLIEIATKIMLGIDFEPPQIQLYDMDYVCVKAPMFSFTRLPNADPILGVEMASTGEVACFGDDIHDAPKLNGGSTDYIVSRDANISSKLPAYSIWRRQMTSSRQEKGEDYPRPFGSSASYYTSMLIQTMSTW